MKRIQVNQALKAVNQALTKRRTRVAQVKVVARALVNQVNRKNRRELLLMKPLFRIFCQVV